MRPKYPQALDFETLCSEDQEKVLFAREVVIKAARSGHIPYILDSDGMEKQNLKAACVLIELLQVEGLHSSISAGYLLKLSGMSEEEISAINLERMDYTA